MFANCCSINEIVERLATIEGDVDLYTWYEGPQGLLEESATFLKEGILEPLYSRKRDIQVYLYSLRNWDFYRSVDRMETSSKLGEAINKIDPAALRCIYATSFFRYTMEPSPLTPFFCEELPKKGWLYALSSGAKPRGKSVAELFGNKPSLFDGIKEMDVGQAYSAMQYVEGYYLIRESVKRALEAGKDKVEIAFVLPNDEDKYYREDLARELPRLLELDLGEKVSSLEVRVQFHLYSYGNNLKDRPYKGGNGPKVTAEKINSYFNYMGSI